MKSLALFLTGLAAGAIATVAGFLIADWASAPKWGKWGKWGKW